MLVRSQNTQRIQLKRHPVSSPSRLKLRSELAKKLLLATDVHPYMARQMAVAVFNFNLTCSAAFEYIFESILSERVFLVGSKYPGQSMVTNLRNSLSSTNRKGWYSLAIMIISC